MTLVLVMIRDTGDRVMFTLDSWGVEHDPDLIITLGSWTVDGDSGCLVAVSIFGKIKDKIRETLLT